VPPKPGDILEVGIDRLAYGGQGIARIDDFVLFVRGALPGDRVRARVTRRKRNYAEARVVDLLEPSPLRVGSGCTSAAQCGGCEWQVLSYEAQLRFKQEQVVESLAHIGGQHEGEPGGYVLEPIRGMTEPWRYRNKMEFSCAEESGRLLIGLHKRGSWREIVETDECRLASPQIEAARAAVADACRALHLRAYDREGRYRPAAAVGDDHVAEPAGPGESEGPRGGGGEQRGAPWNGAEQGHADEQPGQPDRGLLRHLVVRHGSASGDVMAHLFVAHRFPEAAELAARVQASGTVTSFALTVNDSPADAAVGGPARMLFGPPFFRETLAGVPLHVPLTAFLQTNSAMCSELYQTAVRFADLQPADLVWDLYCGLGSLSLLLARGAATVDAVEVQPEAITAAKGNARLNEIGNVHFHVGDVRKVLKDPPPPGRADVIVVDPPRAGLSRKALARAAALGARRFVYVSCNPTTLAGNAAELDALGYRLARVAPVDMFPHTHHIETVALFERRLEADVLPAPAD
jgi:23S rRNA (uracil1939-C5)-methyltransferase